MYAVVKDTLVMAALTLAAPVAFVLGPFLELTYLSAFCTHLNRSVVEVLLV